MEKVGFVGLGRMGRSMAANLQKSQYKLVVHDIRRESAKAHLERGAEWAASPKAVAERRKSRPLPSQSLADYLRGGTGSGRR